MTSPNKFTVDAAKQYLQSVVFIDDQIYYSKLPDLSGLEVGGVTSQFQPDVKATSEPTEVSNKNETKKVTGVFDSKKLVESFAKEGIVCALYQPDKDIDTTVFNLCKRADIVMLDWDLQDEKDEGDKASSIIQELVNSSCKALPHHIRLIAIYTANPSLRDIQKAVSEKLTSLRLPVKAIGDVGCIEVGAVRVIFLGKPSTGRTEEEEKLTIDEASLADHLIDEFAKMNDGILPSYALHGMASIRRNSKRVLDKFHGDLDGAFLLHRALVMGGDEAFDQLPELLAEELMAVIEDEHPQPDTIEELANLYVSSLNIGTPHKPWTNNGATIDHTTYVRKFLKEGIEGISKADRDQCQQVKDLPKRGLRGIKSTQIKDLKKVVSPEDSYSNEQLAALFNLRTQYSSNPPALLFGTIVRYLDGNAEGKWIYGVCIMPLCDCLRLGGQKVRFPFWRLKTDVYCDVPSARKGISIKTSDGQFLELASGGKPKDALWMDEFSVNPSTKTVTSETMYNAKVFKCDGKERGIEWVAQLKPSHAQRLANEIAQSFSRVAVIEAEWLRLLVDK